MDFFNSLENRKKISFCIILILIIFGLVAVITWASSTRYKTFYTDLNNTDSKNLTLLLEENKIPYQMSDLGKTIKIPEEMVEIWRIKLATQGLHLSGNVGYEVFDNQSFGTTSFVQKINKQRALEGELVKTLKYLRGVKRARVHLSIPESSPFVSERTPPSASIVLEIERNVILSETEINGVTSLVASSIVGMSPENVVIIDEKGKKLSQNIGDSLTRLTSNRMVLENKFNRKYERQIEEILNKVVGQGKVIAKVNVALDYSESVIVKTQLDTDNTAVLSESTNSQTTKRTDPLTASSSAGQKDREFQKNTNKQLSTKNYHTPSTVTKSSIPTAGIKKISIAVMIDGKRIPSFDKKDMPILDKNGKQISVYEKWSEANLENFKSIIISSIGIDIKRGDQIIIKNMEFAQEDFSNADALLAIKQNKEFIKSLVKYITIGLIISLFFFIVIRPFIQWVTDNTVESIEDFLPKTLEELEKIQINQKLPGLEDALPQIEEKLNPEKIEGNILKERIVALVESNPSKAAQIVHEMIHTVELDKKIA